MSYTKYVFPTAVLVCVSVMLELTSGAFSVGVGECVYFSRVPTLPCMCTHSGEFASGACPYVHEKGVENASVYMVTTLCVA